MAAKPQQGIRSVIHTLLSLLEDAGIPRIPSESFRKAKFSQPEVTTSFWTTLFHIIHLTKMLDCLASTLPSSSTSASHSTEYLILTVRKHFFGLGYHRIHFYTDPTASRELVLAFAWLLSETEFVKKLTEYHLRAAKTVRIPLRGGQRFLVKVLEKDCDTFREDVEQVRKELSTCLEDFQGGRDVNMKQLESVLQRIVWLKGKMERRLNSSLSCQHSYQKLAHKIHQHTKQASSGEHLTVHEVFLLRHPEQLSSYLDELEKHLVALQRLFEWRTCEPLFWQWMESVLDLDERERNDCSEDDSDDKPIAKMLSREELETRVKTLERDVSALITRNQPHIDKINHTCHTKCKSIKREDIKEELSRTQLPVAMVTFRDGTCDTSGATVAVEQLRDIDVPLCLPPQSSHRQPSRRIQLPSMLEQERAHSESLRSLSVRLEQVQRELAANREKMRETKRAVISQLEAVEHTLPPNICKVHT